jgi:hypothetical protein
VLLARRADSSVILIVLNIKLRMETEHSIPPLSLHDFLQESIALT